MAIITWPASLVPGPGSGFGQQRYDLSFSSEGNGSQQDRLLAPPRWRLSIVQPTVLPPFQSGPWRAIALQLRGRVNHLQAWDFGRPTPLGTARGTLTLAANASAGATSLSLTGIRGGPNLVTHSQAVDDASWSKVNCSVTSSGTTDPLGGNTAERVIEDTAVAAGRYVSKGVTWVAGTTYCISAWVRDVTAGAKRYAGFLVPAAVAGVNTGAQWDMTTGSVTATAGTLEGSGSIAGDNAWRRVWCSVTATVSISSGLQVRFDDAPSSIGGSWTGDGASGLHLWGLQVEVGTVPTEYRGVGTLLAGDMLQVGTGLGTSQLVMVMADATAAADGTMTVSTEPPMRATITSGSTVAWDKPTAYFKLAGGAQSWTYQPSRVGPAMSGIAMDLLESWS